MGFIIFANNIFDDIYGNGDSDITKVDDDIFPIRYSFPLLFVRDNNFLVN